MLTWYSATWPFSSLTRWSLIQAAVTPRRVLVARSSPWRMASSKLEVEVAEISVTRATAMVGVLRDQWWPGPRGTGAGSTWPGPSRCRRCPGRSHQARGEVLLLGRDPGVA